MGAKPRLHISSLMECALMYTLSGQFSTPPICLTVAIRLGGSPVSEKPHIRIINNIK